VDQCYPFGSARWVSNPGNRSVLIDQAVRMLGVSRRTVYYWIRQGRLQTVRTRGGSQRVLVSSMRDTSGWQESALSKSQVGASEVFNIVSA
jgi:excisionase family DNA binding protein